MYDQRCYVGCTLLGSERIIAAGGFNSYDRLKSAEIFHIPTNQWSRIAEMNVKRLLLKTNSKISVFGDV